MSSLLHSVFPRRARGEPDLPEFQAREEGRLSTSHYNLNDTPFPSPVDSGELSSHPSLASSQPPLRQQVVDESTRLTSNSRGGSRSRSGSRPRNGARDGEADAMTPTYMTDKPPCSKSIASAEPSKKVSPYLPAEETPCSVDRPSPSSPSSSSHKHTRRTKKSKNFPGINFKTNSQLAGLTRKLDLKSKLNPTLRLENSGSVARDHLASERTFLAYVRTSLALASMGVAIVQLFTIADLTSKGSGTPLSDASKRIQKFARPLGVTAVLMALIILSIAVYRYFLVQHALPEKMFPVARFSIAFISFVLGSVVVVIFAALLGGRVNS